MGTGTYRTFSSRSQNDVTGSGEYLGWALAFGRFDASARRNLAIGVIRKDYVSYVTSVPTIDNAGPVYIVAPWRQIDDLPHRASVALDCDAGIIYSQRMFDRLRPASTTKTMTLLLACEAVTGGSADPNYVYTVPSWVANNIGGSQMGLLAGEKITLVNLMKGLMPPSGNDASFAIADILEGDNNPWGGSYEGTLLSFQNRMNTRAADFAMTRTTLTNPSGLDAANHFTTARDFTALSYHAMQNSCVRQIVGAPGWLVDHLIPVNTMDGWLSLGGPNPTPGFTPVTEYFSAGYMSNIRSVIPSATGIKGGFTGEGRVTGLWAADAAKGEVFATAFGMRSETDGDVITDCLACTGGGLLQLGRSLCLEDDYLPPPPPPGPFGTLTGIPACRDSVRRLTTHGLELTPGEARVEIYRPTLVTPAVNARIAVVRSSQLRLAPQEQVAFGMGGLTAHQGARIVNRGSAAGQVLVTQTHPSGTTLNATLLPSGVLITPKHLLPATSYVMTIRNTDTAEATLEVEESGYQFERRLVAASPGVPSFEATLQRAGRFSDEVMGVYLVGKDSICSDELDLVVRPPGATVGVPGDSGPPTQGDAAILALRPAAPNPSRAGTTIRFDLARGADVRAGVFDSQGRRVRGLLDGSWHEAGSHPVAWDGLDDSGAKVRAGVYFVRIQAGSIVKRTSLIRLD